MLWIGITILSIAFFLWLALFTYFYLRPRFGTRESLGGGGPRYGYFETWSSAFEEEYGTMGDQDLRMVFGISEYGGTLTIEELEALMRENPQVLAERLRKLEAMGYIVKTSSGRYELTEAGRRAVEMYRERLALRQREEELVEQGG